MKLLSLMPLLVLSFAFRVLAQVATPTYCNGQSTVVEGDSVYANGTRKSLRGEALYPNGTRVIQLGEVVYPNGQRLKIGDEEYHFSGGRVVVGGDLYYPNGQQVQVGTTCYFASGLPMKRCPPQVPFEDQDQGIILKGQMNLKTKKITDRSFEFNEPEVSTTWKVDERGNISNVQTRCDRSLL